MSPSESARSFGSFLHIQSTDSQIDYVEKADAADFESAVHFAGHGKFQWILMAVCGTIYATCAISTTTLSFVLPSAECDFDLSSMDKGKLSAMPLLGMILGCSIWGSLANSHGRRVALMMSLLVDFIAALLSSVSSSFGVFLACRFFNGFGIIGATSIVFSYLGEFLSVKDRDLMLGRLEIFWNIGVILLPGLAWSLLNRSMLRYFSQRADFSPWRVFVLVCSVPSLISLICMYFLPESPKYLMSKEKYREARDVFQIMYKQNTGESKYLYPVLSLEGEVKRNNSSKFSNAMPLYHRILQKWKWTLAEMKELCSRPHITYLSITSFADFGLMASYYTLIMWFPEIFLRFNNFENHNLNATTTGVCVTPDKKPEGGIELILRIFAIELKRCDPSIDNRVFLDTVIIGLSCIPTSVSLSYVMRAIGKKNVLVIGLILAGLSTLLLNVVRNSVQILILACIFEALTSVLEAVLFCVVVELFPTNLRAIALALTVTSGRLGAIAGNVIFGVLIDLNCAIPIYLFGFLLIGSGILCLALPRNESYIRIY